ncbi:YaiI/YqxD family protein [soil metagenome]
MQIWVDADACPNTIKEILFRAAVRTQTRMILVANQPLYAPQSEFITKIQVAAGFDVADNQIVLEMQAGDLVITADVPLADAAITKGGLALNPRGELYSKDNIKQRLAMRDFNETLRSSGIITGGPARLSNKDNQIFAAALDKLLSSR